jgi:hydroxyethylthiazole kinase
MCYDLHGTPEQKGSAMERFGQNAGEILAKIRTTRPVVHSITNYVVMNSTANVLLAMGASPIMAHAPEEVKEIVQIASAVVINIGTLSEMWIGSMLKAVRNAAGLGKPYVLDPVGAGATMLRTETAKRLILEARPTVIRGNASEILALSTEKKTTRGVDSVHSVEDAAVTARDIAAELGTVVAVTGVSDLVTDGKMGLRVEGGHQLMTTVTGTGCAVSVIVGAFLAADPEHPVTASAAALAFFGLAGEKAAAESNAPGTFWVKVLDALYLITPEELTSKARITEI